MKKIRYIGQAYYDLTPGKIYTVEDYCGPNNFGVRDDVGAWNAVAAYAGNWEVVEDSAELAELRAFKAAALARFPALAEPETDDEAANRFDELHYEGQNTVLDTIREAIAWARANPR